MMENVRKQVSDCPVVMKGGYPYVVFSLTDGIYRVHPRVMKEIVGRMKDIGDFDVDYILTPEAMGIPYAVALSMELDIPFTIIRKRKYDLEGEVEVTKSTGYSTSTMYINGVRKGDRVLFVDDMISTGGSLRALVKPLKEIGCEIVQILVAIEKDCDTKALSEELGIPIRSAFGVKIEDNKPVYYDTEY